jgi:membrane associated rhomboid family serine protease
VVGVWFLLQILGGLGTAGGGGVAYSAHIGGFIFGFLLAPLFADVKNPFSNAGRRGTRQRRADRDTPPDRHWNDEDLW